MAAMKIQDGALVTFVTSQLRYDSSNRFISRRLISGASFMSIPSVFFKKWREGRGAGAFDALPSPENAKKARSEWG